MFSELVDIVSEAEEQNINFLKKSYEKIQNTSDWKRVLAIKGVETNLAKLRQDNYIRPDYSNVQLQKMSENAGRDLTAVYDSSGYLSKLMLTAYELDELFHDTLREIFDIDIATGFSKDGRLLYHSGPVKGEERARAKAESDYSDR